MKPVGGEVSATRAGALGDFVFMVGEYQIDAAGVERHRAGGELYDSVTAGGSLFRPDGTLRAALDATLSSPTGIGVAVDDAGAVVGGVRADDVIKALDTQRPAPQQETG